MNKPVQGPDIAQMREALASAADAKLAHVVHFLDTLSGRDAAEAFLAPLRPRLRQVHFRRRIGVGRLVVMPFEVLVVEPRGWKPGMTSIPRHALRPMLATVCAALGARREALDEVLRELDPVAGTLLSVGCEVWPMAARALERAEAPSDMPAADYARLTCMARAVLLQANAVETEVRRSSLGAEVDVRLLHGALKAAAGLGADGFAAELAVLLARFPVADGILALGDEVASGNTALRTAAHEALAGLLERAAAAPPPEDNLARAASEAERTVTLLEQLDAQPRRAAALGAQIAEVREVTARASRASIAHAATVTLPRLAETATDEVDGIDELERSARDLKRLALVTRRLGSRVSTDEVLRNAANATLAKAQALSVADRARLMELLCGAEEALALLDREMRF